MNHGASPGGDARAGHRAVPRAGEAVLARGGGARARLMPREWHVGRRRFESGMAQLKTAQDAWPARENGAVGEPCKDSGTARPPARSQAGLPRPYLLLTSGSQTDEGGHTNVPGADSRADNRAWRGPCFVPEPAHFIERRQREAVARSGNAWSRARCRGPAAADWTIPCEAPGGLTCVSLLEVEKVPKPTLIQKKAD